MVKRSLAIPTLREFGACDVCIGTIVVWQPDNRWLQAATSWHSAGWAGIGTISEPNRQVHRIGTS